MVPRQPGCGSGCSASPVGRDNLSFPSSSFDAQSVKIGQGARDFGSSGLSSVAHSPMVAIRSGNDGGSPPSSSLLQGSSSYGGQGESPTLPGPSRGRAHFGENFATSHRCSDLAADDLDFLANHLSDGSKTGYNYAFKKFIQFCSNFHVDPFTCGPAILVKYIRHLYDNNATYNTVNYHRSAVSKFHSGFAGMKLGSHPLVSQAVKAVFRLRPPLPKYVATFDITKVFAYLQSLPPNEEISLKFLTLKCMFLLTTAIISRVSSVNRLGSELLVYKVSCVLISYFLTIIVCRIIVF